MSDQQENLKKKRGRPSYKTLDDLKRKGEMDGDKRFNKFIEYLKKRKPTPSLEELRSILGRKQTGHLFDKNHGFPIDGTVVPISKNDAFKYHVLFRVPLEFLKIRIEDEEEFFKNKTEKKAVYFTNAYWESIKKYAGSLGENPAIEVIPVSVDSQNNPELVKTYEKLAERIGVVNESITIWENTFKGNNDNPGNQVAYLHAQKTVFKKIISILEEKKRSGVKSSEFRYTRIFNLSPFNVINDKDEYNILADEISKDCLAHIIECFKKYPSYCEFKISKNVSRFRSHCLIDSKIFLTEDYIKFGDNIIPRIFFLDSLEIPSDFGKLIRSIEQDDLRSNLIDIQFTELKQAVEKKMEYLKRLEIGECLITKVLNLLRVEINANQKRTESELLQFIYPYLEKTIKDAHYNSDSPEYRLELIHLAKSIRTPDDSIFGDIIKRRNAFEQGVKKRKNDLTRKLALF